MSKSYYTLVACFDENPSEWSIEFGSYDREEVEVEMDAYDSYGEGFYQIITTGDAQADVEAKVNELNEKLLSDRGLLYEAGDHMKLWVNQGERTAWVLGTLNDLMIVEYEMPAGTTALNILKNEKDYNQNFGWHDDEKLPNGRAKYYPKSVSYKSCPDKWIQAIREGCGCWEGICQRNGLVPFPDEAYDLPVSDWYMDIIDTTNKESK